MRTNRNFWAIVPAAGTGSRMQSDIPKQYLTIAGKTILELTLQKLRLIKEIKGIIVAIAPNDTHFGNLKNLPPNLIRVDGGDQRANSVLNGLKHLKQIGASADWALIHDAARPCVRAENIEKLIHHVLTHKKGAILGSPVSDTLKKVKDNDIQATIDRSTLWQAHTPQIFPINQLYEALEKALSQHLNITDESSAIELSGETPLIVADARDNIKVTHPEDLHLASAILKSQESTHT